MIYVITLGYAPARILRAGVSRFYETCELPRVMYRHILMDQHYPLKRPEVVSALKDLSLSYRCELWDPGQALGLHGGLNWALQRIKPNPCDILVLYDPDSYPLGAGWLGAIVEGIRAGGYAVVGLMDPRAEKEVAERKSGEEMTPGGLRILRVGSPCVISVAGYDAEFILSAGGFHETNAWYGGLEAKMWTFLGARKWGYLPQCREDHRLRDRQDVEFRNYKWAHAHLRNFPGSFEEFLQSGNPVRSPEVLP